ncbi:MAG TPA: primosomal protein N', partial [Candidatus Eremiobacteraceae bacterium]|nr:primosomal protein N' [Candidatus Eremiobacteraceae bacterium]
MTGETCVDVVVDVQTAKLDGSFTYLTGDEIPAVGARVRVPFAGRDVLGWVVTEPAIAGDPNALRRIESVDEVEPIDAAAVELARWMSRRYACTLREAIAAVSARRATRQTAPAYRFAEAPIRVEGIAAMLHARYGDKPFGSLSARRTLRASGARIAMAEVTRELERLARSGVLCKDAARIRNPVEARRAYLVRPSPATHQPVKGVSRRRLMDALGEFGPMELTLAASRAGVTPAVIRSAAQAGACTIEELPNAVVARATAQPSIPTVPQAAAIAAIEDAMRHGRDVLLHGVTGSGKTFIYARCVDRLRERGGRAIVLVPEISLTPQTAGRFAAIYGAKVGVVHSGLSEGERARVWEDARAGIIDVVVGARSAVFAPLPRLGLVIVDEEHEASYKQDVAPRYDAAAVARKRMRDAGGTVILGSATPSLESYASARGGTMDYVRLLERATNAPLPPVEIVDMTAHAEGPRRPLGPALVGAIEHALAKGEKALLFVNRRGYAGVLLCRACGFAPRCRRCAVSLVVHTASSSMRCHVCGDAYRLPSRCPKCESTDLKPFG